MALRNIVFNNPHFDAILRQSADDGERWRAWLDKMGRQAKGIKGEAGFAYLRDVFPTVGGRSDSFGDFVRVIGLLRTTAIEGDSNKRWTSKFTFPYGPASLFPDAGLKSDGTLSTDRRFFARTGELAYLMLCRSGRGEALYARLQRSVFDPRSAWNRLVERLQPTGASEGTESYVGYLPYASLPDYERLADDLLAVLDIGLPGYDALPHVVDLLGLHLVLYALRRAAEWVPGAAEPHLVLEIIAPKRTSVRDQAGESFQYNDGLGEHALMHFIEAEIERSDAWRAACTIEHDDERSVALARVLWEKARWKEARDAAEAQPTAKRAFYADPQEALDQLRAAAKRRYAGHLGHVHQSYAQAIGLASRRGTKRIRYAPSDQLLKTLVFAVVPKRMEFNQFLIALWERYRMIIGHAQAELVLPSDARDKDDFDQNVGRLEMRLASLGLLRRLSDACAYVENPMEVAP